MANEKLKSNEGVITYTLGGAFDNAPAFTTPVTWTCYVKNYRREVTIGSVDAGALCDTTEKNIPTRSGGSVSFDCFVDVTNQTIFQSLIGTYLRIVFTPKSGGTAITDDGFIDKVGLTVERDDMQMESVSIKLGVQGA